MKNKEKDNFTNQILKKIKKKTIKVGIIGLGYVGLKLQIQFAQNKINTFGFDKDKIKIFNLKKNTFYYYIFKFSLKYHFYFKSN